MENTKVTVKIFGQEYTISGNKPEEHILKVADYVDKKMSEISEALQNTQRQAVPILASVNLADEYLSAMERFQYLEENNEKAETEIQHYLKLWEDAKENHMKYQEDMKAIKDENENLKEKIEEKEFQLLEMEESIKNIKDDSQEVSSKAFDELEKKYKDLESSFFDIQMENIQLKGEIDRYKKKME